VGEVPEAVTIHPANSKEPNPLLEVLRGKSDEDPDDCGDSDDK